MHYAIVVSDFNQVITVKLLNGAYERLLEKGVPAENIKVVHVPGAVEIPLTAKRLANTKRFQAIICLGSVIQGETNHYDYVCEQVSQGCQRVMLDYDLPVIFGILTTPNVALAHDRTGGRSGHKGIEAADAALRMVEVLSKI